MTLFSNDPKLKQISDIYILKSSAATSISGRNIQYTIDLLIIITGIVSIHITDGATAITSIIPITGNLTYNSF
jgi:hypothetical protein